jgi:carboxylate-amine ligase
MFPRCGIPDPYSGWAEYERYVRFLYETDSIQEHTQIWWSVRPHLAFPTVEIRICDGQPQLAEAQSLAALLYALTVRVARALDDGEELLALPHGLLEENLWRAIRHGLSGDLIDLTRYPPPSVRPARDALAELVEWVLPAAEDVGAATALIVPQANAAERQLARYEAGETIEAIFAEEVLEPARV